MEDHDVGLRTVERRLSVDLPLIWEGAVEKAQQGPLALGKRLVPLHQSVPVGEDTPTGAYLGHGQFPLPRCAQNRLYLREGVKARFPAGDFGRMPLSG